MIQLQQIGTITSPFDRPEDMPVQPTGAADILGTVVVNSEFEAGLSDLGGFSHIILIYFLHLSNGFSLRVKPFLDDREHGVFATRAPRRPNPIGLSVVRLLRIEKNILCIQGVDVVNGTPLLDIKPYVPAVDSIPADRVGWMDGRTGNFRTARSDERFSEMDQQSAAQP